MESKEGLKELIKTDVAKLSENFEYLEKTTDDILQELSKSIDKIDFEILAFPDIETVKKQIEDLKEFVYNEDGTYNKDNKSEFEKYKKLNKRLAGCKLSKNHYLVLCIEQLLKIAFSIKGLLRFKILDPFVSKKEKNFLSAIIACFKISPYPQIISLLGRDFKKIMSEITKLGPV